MKSTISHITHASPCHNQKPSLCRWSKKAVTVTGAKPFIHTHDDHIDSTPNCTTPDTFQGAPMRASTIAISYTFAHPQPTSLAAWIAPPPTHPHLMRHHASLTHANRMRHHASLTHTHHMRHHASVASPRAPAGGQGATSTHPLVQPQLQAHQVPLCLPWHLHQALRCCRSPALPLQQVLHLLSWAQQHHLAGQSLGAAVAAASGSAAAPVVAAAAAVAAAAPAWGPAVRAAAWHRSWPKHAQGAQSPAAGSAAQVSPARRPLLPPGSWTLEKAKNDRR
eukprot:1144162-Pelagomonas_calceolata.AAC.4